MLVLDNAVENARSGEFLEIQRQSVAAKRYTTREGIISSLCGVNIG